MKRNTLKFFFLFLWKIIPSCLATRADEITTIPSSERSGTVGNRLGALYCPDGSYIQTYRQQVDTTTSGPFKDAWGLVTIEYTCVNYFDNTIKTVITPAGIQTDTNFVWGDLKTCTDGKTFGYMKSFMFKYGDSSFAATGIKMKCLDKIEIESSGTLATGMWETYTDCPTYSAMCGFQIKYDDRSSILDNSGLNDIKFFCCGICDFNNRYFDLTLKACKLCNYACKGCTGAEANKCTACHFGQTLSSTNECSIGTSINEINLDQNPITQDGWIFGTPASSSISSTCGYLGNILGGQTILGGNNYIQKTFSLNLPYYEIKYFLRFIKIDSWDQEEFYIEINGLKALSKKFSSYDSGLYGDVCGQSFYLETEEFFEIKLTSTELSFSNSLTIKMGALLGATLTDEAWGVSNIYLFTENCLLICRTCNREGACLSCYDNAALDTNGKCVCNAGYFMLTLSPCTQAPCSECLISCPPRQFGYVVKRLCFDCSPVCLSCNGINDFSCLSCDYPKYYASYSKTCLYACASDDYIIDSNRTCCKTCPVGTAPNSSTKRCDNICNSQQYMDSLAICQNCHPSCLTCSNALDSNCLSCSAPNFLQGTSCVPTCQSPYFGSTITRTCVNICPTPLYGSNIDRMCVDTCPAGQYQDSGFHICRDCSANCEVCTSVSHCTSCYIDFFLHLDACVSSCIYPYWGDLDTETCVASCPSSLVGDPVDRICKILVCHPTCLQCDGFTLSDCLSCFSPNFLSQKTCLTSCPSGSYGDTIDRVCKTCINNCATCDSASICSSCVNDYFLDKNLKSCSTSCPINYFADLANKVCIVNCHTTCLTCKGSTANDCLTCTSTNYLNSNACVSTCPAKTYARDSDRSCQPCYLSCQTCRSPGNLCDTCIENRFKFQDSCVQVCPSPFWGSTSGTSWKCENDCGGGFFQNLDNRTCLKCNSTCETCNGPLDNNCLSCLSGSFLEIDSKCIACNSICKECYKKAGNCTACPSEYKIYSESSTTSTCIRLNCNSFCAKCVGDNRCETCLNSNYYLETVSITEKECKEKVKVDISLAALSNPKIFQLKFSNTWPELFDSLVNNTLIKITKLDSKSYNCSLTKGTSSINNDNFVINCVYTTNVTSDLSLSIKITNYPPNSDVSSHYLIKDSLEIALSSYIYCGEGIAWREATQTCYSPSHVTPYIRLTNDPQTIIYGFDIAVPEELETSIANNTQISIPSLNSSIYSATIARSSDSPRFTYKITLIYTNQIKHHPLIFVTLALSPRLKSNESLVFTKEVVQIEVMDYYYLAADTQKAVENSANVVKSSSSTADQAFIGSNIISPGSTFMIKSLVINQIIHLMRFVKINYPPNILAIFQSKLGQAAFVPEFELSEDQEDGIPDGAYYQFKISSYVLNNCGSFLLTCYAIILIGLLFRLSGIAFKNILLRQKFFLIVYGFLYDFFVWNFPISFFLAKYQTISLLLGVALRFPTKITVKGVLNFTFAITSSIFIFAVPILSIIIIHKMRNFAHIISVIKPFSDVAQPRGTFQAKLQKDGKGPKFSLLAVEDISSHKKPDVSVTNDSGNNSPKTLSGNGSPSVFNEEDNKKDSRFHSNLRDSAIETDNIVENSTKTKDMKVTPVKSGNINKFDLKRDEVSDFLTPTDRGISNFNHEHEISTPIKEVKVEPRKKMSFLDPKKNLLIPDDNQDTTTSSRPSKINFNKGLKWNSFVDSVKKKSLELKQSTLNILKEGKRKFSSFFKPSPSGSIAHNLDRVKRNYKVFHQEYNIVYAITHYFMIFEIFRQLIITFIIIGLDNWPLTQTILITLTNLVLFIGTIVFRPYTKLKIFIQSLITEFMLLLACTGFLTLAILDKQEDNDLETRLNIGWWVSYTNMSIIFFMLGMFGLQVLSMLVKFAKFLKNKLVKSNKVG